MITVTMDPNLDTMYYQIEDDSMNSFICGKNVSMMLCDDSTEDSCSNRGDAGAGGTSNPSMYHDDDAATVIMSWYDPIGSYGAVTFFSSADCMNNSWAFFANDDGGKYNKADMESVGFPNDELDAVMLPVGYTLTIWSEDGQTGDSKTFDGQENSDGSLYCNSFQDDDMNDRTTSFTITKNATPTAAAGEW